MDTHVGGENRGNNFNILRLVFAVLVLLSHAFELVDGDRKREILTSLFGTISLGELAVDGFFLMSGYLIVQSWALHPSGARFLKNRILRIYPGFIAAGIVCSFVVGPLSVGSFSYLSEFPVLAFIFNLCGFQLIQAPGIFAGQPFPLLNGSLWTIQFEFLCYLAVLAVGRLGGIKNKGIWFALSGMLFLTELYQNIFFVRHQALPFSQFFAFLIGLGTFFFTGGSYYLLRQKIYRGNWALFALLALVPFMFSKVMAEPALALLGGYALYYVAFRPVRWLKAARQWADISYGVYLYGWPVEKLLNWYAGGMSPWALFATSLPITLGCGWASWCLVEKYFLRLKSS